MVCVCCVCVHVCVSVCSVCVVCSVCCVCIYTRETTPSRVDQRAAIENGYSTRVQSVLGVRLLTVRDKQAEQLLAGPERLRLEDTRDGHLAVPVQQVHQHVRDVRVLRAHNPR